MLIFCILLYWSLYQSFSQPKEPACKSLRLQDLSDFQYSRPSDISVKVIYWACVFTEGSYEIGSVVLSVRPSVLTLFLLIFCMKVEGHNWKKVTKSDFCFSVLFHQNLGKRGKYEPKMPFFVYISRHNRILWCFFYIVFCYILTNKK